MAEERAYFLRRAADHARLADASPDEAARLLHQRFAAAYRERIANLPAADDDMAPRPARSGTDRH